MRIGVRSGGHSWAGNHVRDGGMLLDVSGCDEVDDRRRRDAPHASSPAAAATRCSRDARRARPLLPRRPLPRRRARRLPAAGRLRLERPRARARVHERRGDRRGHRRRRAGPRRRGRERRPVLGGARLRPRLLRRRHPLPPAPVSGPQVIANASTPTRSTLLEEVFRWAHEIGPRSRRGMELMLFIHRDAAGEPEVVVTGPGARREPRRRRARRSRCSRPARSSTARRPRSRTSPARIDDLYAGGARELPGRPPLRRRQHVDPRARRRSCSRACAGSPRRCRRRPRTCCG